MRLPPTSIRLDPALLLSDKSSIVRQMASPQYPRITVRLEPELIDKVDSLAEEQGVSRSRVVRTLIVDGLATGSPVVERRQPPEDSTPDGGMPAQSWGARVRQLRRHMPKAAAERMADEEWKSKGVG